MELPFVIPKLTCSFLKSYFFIYLDKVVQNFNINHLAYCFEINPKSPVLFLQPTEGASTVTWFQRLHRRGETGSRQVRGEADHERAPSTKLHLGAVSQCVGQMYGRRGYERLGS